MSYPVYNGSHSHASASSVKTLRQSVQIPLWICHLHEMCLRITDSLSLDLPGNRLGFPPGLHPPFWVWTWVDVCLEHWEQPLVRLIRLHLFKHTTDWSFFSCVVCSLFFQSVAVCYPNWIVGNVVPVLPPPPNVDDYVHLLLCLLSALQLLNYISGDHCS